MVVDVAAEGDAEVAASAVAGGAGVVVWVAAVEGIWDTRSNWASGVAGANWG